MTLSRRSILRIGGLAVLNILEPLATRAAKGATIDFPGLTSADKQQNATPVGPFKGKRWWENPERLRSGRKRPSGIMNWGTAESLAKYEREVAYVDCGTQRSIGKLTSWEALAGGPLGKTEVIDRRSQLDWPGTPIGVLMDHIPPGKAG